MSDMNIMYFDDGYRAIISYDPEIDMFRGDFLEFDGVSFYGDSVEALRNDGEESLRLAAEKLSDGKERP